MARHLITGGSGFVGSHTAEHLLSEGEEVVVYDVAAPDVPGTDLRQRVEYIDGDVRDRSRLAEAMSDIDYVHHNVALVPLTKAGDEFREVNVTGTRNVMAAALEAGVDGVSHVSSSAVYDLSRMPVTEESPLDPIGAYGQSKLDGDRVVKRYADEGLPVNIIRPRTVLDERRAGIYQILFDWLERDARIYMLGDGTNEFQLVSGRDIAAASRLAATADISGEVFNIGNDDYNTLGEDLRHLVEYADSDSRITWVPARPVSLTLQVLDYLRLSPLAPWHYKTVYKDYYFDTTKAREILGWEPTDSNFDVFERAYDWYANHDVASSDNHGSIHQTAPPQKILGLLRKVSK
jgi:nucleoside-diphosphate-sugar epimerase